MDEENIQSEDIDENFEDDEETVEEQVEDTTTRVDALINLLIKKNLISEEELQKEYETLFDED